MLNQKRASIAQLYLVTAIIAITSLVFLYVSSGLGTILLIADFVLSIIIMTKAKAAKVKKTGATIILVSDIVLAVGFLLTIIILAGIIASSSYGFSHFDFYDMMYSGGISVIIFFIIVIGVYYILKIVGIVFCFLAYNAAKKPILEDSSDPTQTVQSQPTDLNDF